MMKAKNSPRPIGITFLGLFFLLLFALKVGVGDTAVQNLSWWWVTAPLWAPFALAAFLYALAGIADAVTKKWLE